MASTAGVICGISSNVIVKPTLETFSRATPSTISFLSGTMVLTMSCYSVLRSLHSGKTAVDTRTGTPLAPVAALSGAAGKELFHLIRDMSGQVKLIVAV